MSSHHFVRDLQEPSLIIANGASCSSELLGQLLEWNPFVLVLDGALHRVLELGIRFDALLGDFDGITDPEHLLEQYQPVQVIHTPDQEYSDLEKGIAWLIDQGHKACNIVWATGLRADHAFHNLAMLPKFQEQIDLVMLDDYSKVFPLKKQFRKWYPKGFNISLIPVPEVSGLHTENLQYNVQDASWALPWRTGSSNSVADEGFVNIHYSSGHLLMMECFDHPFKTQ
ncbi:MAG: thiamine diphosphokinase [Bacteroidetes bacterium]|nr:thiamine diphosphokinase [Bacteroidota bacterium]